MCSYPGQLTYINVSCHLNFPFDNYLLNAYEECFP